MCVSGVFPENWAHMLRRGIVKTMVTSPVRVEIPVRQTGRSDLATSSLNIDIHHRAMFDRLWPAENLATEELQVQLLKSCRDCNDVLQLFGYLMTRGVAWEQIDENIKRPNDQWLKLEYHVTCSAFDLQRLRELSKSADEYGFTAYVDGKIVFRGAPRRNRQQQLRQPARV